MRRGSTLVKDQNSVGKINEKTKSARRLNTNLETAEKDIHLVVKQTDNQVSVKNERQQIKEPLVSSGIKNDATGKEISGTSSSADRNKNISAAEGSSYDASLTAEKFEVEAAIVSEPKNLLQVSPPVISSKDLSAISTVSITQIRNKSSGQYKRIKTIKEYVQHFLFTFCGLNSFAKRPSVFQGG